MDQRYGFGRYIGAGLDLDFHFAEEKSTTKSATEDSGGHLEVWPVVRLGMSYRDRGSPIPAIRFYMLGGLRPVKDVDYTVRLGTGLSIPALLPLIEIGLPTLIELNVDHGPAGERVSLRLGWNV